jgi:hypothetical protein
LEKKSAGGMRINFSTEKIYSFVLILKNSVIKFIMSRR